MINCKSIFLFLAFSKIKTSVFCKYMLYFHMTHAQIGASMQKHAMYKESICFSRLLYRCSGITRIRNSSQQLRLNGLLQVNGLRMGAISWQRQQLRGFKLTMGMLQLAISGPCSTRYDAWKISCNYVASVIHHPYLFLWLSIIGDQFKQHLWGDIGH